MSPHTTTEEGRFVLTRKAVRSLLAVGLGVAVLVLTGGTAAYGRPAAPFRLAAATRPVQASARPTTRPALRPLVSTTISGPVDTPPGGDTFTTAFGSGPVLLQTPGQTYTFTGINTGLFDNLWWGPADTSSSSIGVSACGAFTYNSSQPDLANGVGHWSSTSNSSIPGGPFACTFTLTVTDINGSPLALINSTDVGLTQGAVVRVPAAGSFKANMYISIDGQTNTIGWIDFNRHALFIGGCPANCIQSDFTGGFFYQNDSPSASVPNFSIGEGVSIDGQVAIITDGDPTSTASEYSASIDWGDGNTSPGTVTGTTGGPFSVNGSHVWADEGSYSVTVTITDDDNSAADMSASGTATVTESDGLTNSVAIAITTAADGSFSGDVISFTMSNPNVAADFYAVIDWGDGNTGPGIVVVSSSTLTVSGSHTYSSTGAYSVSVQVFDDAPGVAAGSASGSASFNPTAAPDAYSLTVNQVLNVPAPGVLQNDTGASLTAQQTAFGPNGTLVLNTDGSFSYTPNSGFSGTDGYRYRACSGDACSSEVDVSFTIAPSAVADSYATPFETALNISAPGVLANDVGTSLIAVGATSPSHGSLTLNSNGSFSYTPDSGFTGNDSFTYRARTSGGPFSTAVTVTIAVGSGVIANADSYTTGYAHKLTVAAPGVIANDTGTGLIVNAVTSLPHHGSLTMQPNGSFSFVPAAGFSGQDTFSYTVRDTHGVVSNAAVVTIAVVPTATAQSYVMTSGHTRTVASPGVLKGGRGVPTFIASVASGPAHGALNLHADGSFSYTPQVGFSGLDSFTYTITDSNGAVSLPATVTMSVLPRALIDKFTIKAGGTLSAAAPGVLVNDIGTGLHAVLVTSATNGSLTLNPDGSLTYTPAAGYSGPDSFSYRVMDSSSLASAPVIATIKVVPAAIADAYVTAHNTPLVVAAGSGVLANDIGTALTLGSVKALPTHGTLTISSDGSFTYTPNSGYVGSDSFTYTCRDASGNLSAPAMVTISIT